MTPKALANGLRVRAAQAEDLDPLVTLARKAGLGMTTLPPDRGALGAKIDHSLESFRAVTATGLGETYLLVLEDCETGAIAGTASVMAGVGLEIGKSFYSYKIHQVRHSSRTLARSVNYSVLHLVSDHAGDTEVGGLFLDPDYRAAGAGKLLARSRYLLMAEFPARFPQTVIAEMRGRLDADGSSPFWEAVGRRFFGMDFAAADRLCGTAGTGFIHELMPREPIIADLLPDAARAVLGKPHPVSARALHMLQEEGFTYDGMIDIFDAGPSVHAPLDKIEAVRRSRRYEARPANDPMPGADDYLVATTALGDFRVVQTPARPEEETLALPATAMARLGADAGALLRAVPLAYGEEA